jgi:hypothetical protein
MLGMIGALVPTFLLSRLGLLLTRRWTGSWFRILLVHTLSLAVSVLIGAYGFSDGGEMAWATAFFIYAVPQFVWLVVDMARWGAATADDEGSAS